MIYHFVAGISNTNIADKIAKQVRYAHRTLQDAFKRALTLEAGLQLAEGVHLGKFPQVMQVSTMSPATMTVLKVVYTKPMLGIVEQDPMLVGSEEDWTTFKKIAKLPSALQW